MATEQQYSTVEEVSFSSGGGEVGRALYSNGEGSLSRCSGVTTSAHQSVLYRQRTYDKASSFSTAIQDAYYQSELPPAPICL